MSNKKSNVLRIAVLAVVLIAGISFKVLYKPTYEASDEPFDRIEGDPNNHDEKGRMAIAESEERNRYMEQWGVPRDVWSAPESKWLSSLRNIARDEIGKRKSDLLILPVQGDNNALAPIERSLISRFVGGRIERTSDLKVTDFDRVIGFLGANVSTYPQQSIRELAELSKAKRVLALYASHDRNGKWTLTATLYGGDFPAEEATYRWQQLDYGPSNPPSMSLDVIVEEITEFAVGTTVSATKVDAPFSATRFVFPESLDEMVKRAKETPLHAAAYLQLLASLHPQGNYNQWRLNLLERSLAELQSVDPSARYSRYFKARAYAKLGQRPAAISVLSTPENEHEKALLAYLNGNFSELKSLVEGMGTDALDFMAWRDLIDLEEVYSVGRDRDIEAQFQARYPNWAIFIDRSFRDSELYGYHSTAWTRTGLAVLLESRSMIVAEVLKDWLRVAFPATDPNEDRLLFELAETARGHLLGESMRSRSAVTKLDVIDLAKAMAVANHLSSVRRASDFLGLEQDAIDLIDERESIYGGHPEVTLLKGRILGDIASELMGEERKELDRESNVALLNGYSWSGSITELAASTGKNYVRLFNGTQQHMRYRIGTTIGSKAGPSARFYEWPRGSVWFSPDDDLRMTEEQYEECAQYSTLSFHCPARYIEKKADRPRPGDTASSGFAVLQEFADRFEGNPDKKRLTAKFYRFGETLQARESRIRADIENGDESVTAYSTLGLILFRQSRYKEAEEVWRSFPGLKVPGRSTRVANDNYAEKWGSMLYWVGQYELALPLYRIANSSTGSAANYVAAQRTALINGDLREAANRASQRYSRYESQYGLRDLIQILFSAGVSDAAWELFGQAESEGYNVQMFSGALVGQRVAGMSLDDISEWLAGSQERANAASGTKRLAARHLLMAGAMDRKPDSAFGELVSAFDWAEKGRYIPGPSDDPLEYKGPAMLSSIVLVGKGRVAHDPFYPETFDEQRHPQDHVVDTRYYMMAEAMRAFLDGKFGDAYAQFDKASAYYSPEEFLPYHVFSAAKVDRTAHLLAALQHNDERLDETRSAGVDLFATVGYRFDEDIAYAVLEAFDGNHSESIARLNAALNNRPFLDRRSVYPMYVLVDIAERLYQETGREEYQTFALDLARRHTVILPMYAWAYFVVATHSNNADEKVAATASGLALDPLSFRASELPAQLRADAEKMLQRDGPPYLSKTR